MVLLDGNYDFRLQGQGEAFFERETNQPGVLSQQLGLVWSVRSNGLDLIMITQSKMLVASEPPEALPSGHYLRFESLEDTAEYLLFSNSGKVYRVKRQALKDAIEQGYVKA